MRRERDSMGEVEVPESCYYGAQTARSLHFFCIGQERMPLALVRALALIKRAAAEVNGAYAFLSPEKAKWIIQASDEVRSGKWADQFPLSVWQTGSGTQTHMNVNEVIANRANELAGSEKGSKWPIHPHDDVNRSQSSNDVFPTAIHIAVVEEWVTQLLPTLSELREAFHQKAELFFPFVKVGRTHLMDAVPIRVGQEFSGYVAQLDRAIEGIRIALQGLYPLAIGGTAVGTGMNAPPRFGEKMVEAIRMLTSLPFVRAPNPFAALSSHEPLVQASGALRTLATALMKIARDIAWMGSGPRCGLQELSLPANEPGSSIMPGKVNPTQCEAMIMVAIQVIGLDCAIAIANGQGNFELNVCTPLIAYNLLTATQLLRDAAYSFATHLVRGLSVCEQQLSDMLSRSLMLGTALTPIIGYDKATRAIQKAYQDNISLKEACLQLNFLSTEAYDKAMDPLQMV